MDPVLLTIPDTGVGEKKSGFERARDTITL